MLYYGSIYSHQKRGIRWLLLKKTISLQPELEKEIEEIAREEGRPLSTVIQDALRLARQERLKKEFYQLQDYEHGMWSNLKNSVNKIIVKQSIRKHNFM